MVYETLTTNRSMRMRKEAIGRTYHHDTGLPPWRLERGVEEKSGLGQRAQGVGGKRRTAHIDQGDRGSRPCRGSSISFDAKN